MLRSFQIATNDLPAQHKILPARQRRFYWRCWDSLKLEDGVLFRKFDRKDASGNHWQFLVPRCLREYVLKQMHNSLLSAHLGRKKTKEKIKQRFYWFGLGEDVDSWIRQCDKCRANQPPAQTQRAKLGDMRVGSPLDRLATDILGPFPETERGNKYILVVMDYFTKLGGDSSDSKPNIEHLRSSYLKRGNFSVWLSFRLT